MRFPWTRRIDEAKAQTEHAKNEYEWAVQNRTDVSSLVRKVINQGQQNHLIENLNAVARGGHR